MGQIRGEMAARGVHASRTVVLLPYAQLMQQARSAWLHPLEGATPGVNSPAHFLPRFETSMNWTRSLGGFEPGQDDIQLDAARDVLTAASMLARSGLATYQDLMEAAWSLARQAAAMAARILQGEGAWAWDNSVLAWQGNEIELLYQGQCLRLDRLVPACGPAARGPLVGAGLQVGPGAAGTAGVAGPVARLPGGGAGDLSGRRGESRVLERPRYVDRNE